MLLLASVGCRQRQPAYFDALWADDTLVTDSFLLDVGIAAPASSVTSGSEPPSSKSSYYDSSESYDDDDDDDDDTETVEERRLRHYNQGYIDGDQNMFGDSYDGDVGDASFDMDYVDGLFDGHADSFWYDTEPDY